VIERENAAPGTATSRELQDTAATSDDPDRALTTLRGASVAVDPHRAAQVAIAICWAVLAVLVVVLFLVGIHKNDQINSLKQHGVAVEDTVDSCSGLLGGSGSNAAGFRCWGTFTLGGDRYTKDIPGTVLRAPGSKVAAVADPSEPGLITTASALANEHASASVFIAPAILLAVLALLTGVLASRVRAGGRHPAKRPGSKG
jgi:hypothetical protein